jgi:hypothetical protein
VHHTAGFGVGPSHVTAHAIDDGTHPGAVLLTAQTASAAGAVVGGASGVVVGAGSSAVPPQANRTRARATDEMKREQVTILDMPSVGPAIVAGCLIVVRV